jgi:hypothetical protein
VTYAYAEPPEPSEGIFYCPGCACDREFETDPEFAADSEHRRVLNPPLYCTICATRIDVTYKVLQIWPEPEVRIERPALTDEQRAAGRLRLMQSRITRPIDEEEVDEVQISTTTREDDVKQQLEMLSRGVRR